VVTRYALMSARHLARHRIKLLVVACQHGVRAQPARARRRAAHPRPGVIEPGARIAAARTRGGAIAVLGTPATVASGAIPVALRRLAPLAPVIARACPLFVPLAEGRLDGRRSAAPGGGALYLADLRRAGVDTAVLGCTHYPLLARTIAEVLGPQVAIIDSAEAVTQSVIDLLRAHGLLRNSPDDAPRHRTLCTDVPNPVPGRGRALLGRPCRRGWNWSILAP